VANNGNYNEAVRALGKYSYFATLIRITSGSNFENWFILNKEQIMAKDKKKKKGKKKKKNKKKGKKK